MLSPRVSSGNQPPIQLNPYLKEDHSKNALQLRCKSLAYKTLSVITIVAIVAIVAAVFAVALGLAAATGALPFILLGLAVSTPFLAMASSKFKAMASGRDAQYRVEKGVADEFKKIAHWKTSEIQKFFADHQLSTDQLPLQALGLLNPAHPLCALLPLIARYNFCAKDAREQETLSIEMRENKFEDYSKRLKYRNSGYSLHESFAMRRAVEAAHLSQILQNPTITAKLHDYVELHPKPFDERMLDRTYDNNDVYLTFKDNGRAPVTVTQLEQLNLDPDAIRALIPIQV